MRVIYASAIANKRLMLLLQTAQARFQFEIQQQWQYQPIPKPWMMGGKSVGTTPIFSFEQRSLYAIMLLVTRIPDCNVHILNCITSFIESNEDAVNRNPKKIKQALHRWTMAAIMAMFKIGDEPGVFQN